MPRKKPDIHYLYKTTCKVTGKYYVGMHSTCSLEDGYMGSGKRLTYSIRKYGKENHVKEILEFFDCRELLAEAEKKAITSEMLVDVNCMNLVFGGEGGGGCSFFSKEKLIDFAKKGGNIHALRIKTDPEYRKKVSESGRKQMLKAHEEGLLTGTTRFTGMKHSEETKRLLSDIKRGTGTGDGNSQFGSMWITNGVENRKVKKDDEIPVGWYKGRK